MNWILKLILNAIAVLITAYLLPGITIDGFGTALIVALVLSLLNMTLKPLLIIITIPVTLLTLGLFLLVINAGIILLADDLVSGFQVKGFWWALLFSMVLSFLNSVLLNASEENNKKNKYE